METLKNERLEKLEKLSDAVRNGIPVTYAEALAVVEYQENLKENRKETIVRRVLKWFNYA